MYLTSKWKNYKKNEINENFFNCIILLSQYNLLLLLIEKFNQDLNRFDTHEILNKIFFLSFMYFHF